MQQPELETLDQLVGGDMKMSVIRRFYPNDEHFRRAILAMLHERDLILIDPDGIEPPAWMRKNVLNDPTCWSEYRLSVTDSGARRVC